MIPMLVSVLAMHAVGQEAEVVGQRPYEMVWANRNEDDHPPLVDFEDLTGWDVETTNCEATLKRTREQQLWGRYVAKLTYRGTGGGPQVRIVPPAPIPIREPFDAVTLWVYGNNWGYAPDPQTPQVGVYALFGDAQGNEFSVWLYNVDWTEWNLLHRRLTPEQIERVKAGAEFRGLLITNCRNKQDRVIYLDNLAVFTEQFPPLSFEPRPERGIPMFPGQTVGTNTGPGKLPFPTRLETILPDNLTENFSTGLSVEQGAYVFTYRGEDGQLSYRVAPATGTWDDISAQWQGRGGVIRPCVGGGVWLLVNDQAVAPQRAEHLGTGAQDQTVVSRWRLSVGDVSTEVTYTYRLWNKSLVIDVVAPGGQVAEVRYGRAVGVDNPRLVTNPYYPASGGGRPAVVVCGSLEQPLFLTGNTDWYLSNASEPWASNEVSEAGVVYNGGTRYIPLTNGRRNDCYERFFITLSPRYEEMLPTIPNPPSPWKHVTGTRLWRAHGAGNREADIRFWTECHRYGMTQVVITDHETGWRDGGESFTFRTRPAPGKGGDQGQYDYARVLQDKLGFVYGPYNNFTDFAPVNEYWSTDLIARTPDNQLQHAWMRCYAPKPARAIEYAARLPYIIEDKFHFSTAYCDVHTAVAPWHRVDYDARVPGAGTFTAVFYLYGEIMLHQKQAWDGPVYSEGNHHSFYSGLTDGNYAQDQAYGLGVNPWLVDFDLRKMHDLCCNFGMGNPDMFYGGAPLPAGIRSGEDPWVDRFLTATVAFGHPGFLTYEGGLKNALRSYYMLQQLHSRYCLASPTDIRYVSAEGTLLDTSAAVATGAYRRSQIVTRYSDGTVTAANGSLTERLVADAFGRHVDLPPHGYAGWTADGSIEVLASDPGGHRCDYAATPAYLYVDGRGRMMRFPKAAGNGIGICRLLDNGQYEVILVGGAEAGFAIRANQAVALDQDRNQIGPAEVRVARGLTYVMPVPGAFSYMLQEVPGAEAPQLSCPRAEVIAGERVVVHGEQAHEIQIPAEARVGDRIWQQLEGQWIDFTVVPLADAEVALEGNELVVSLRSNLPTAETVTVSAQGKTAAVHLEPGHRGQVRLDLGPPQEEGAELLTVQLRAGELSQNIERGLRTARGHPRAVELPSRWQGGMCLRGGTETTDFGQTGAYAHPQRSACGEVEKDALGMHPPWRGGVGYTYALYDPLELPPRPPAAFRAVVGKGDGSDPGDGILYRVVVVDAAGTQTTVAQHTVTEHRWEPIEADLSAWAGQTVRLKLIADVGPEDNSVGDWACWADLRVESLEPALLRTLETSGERYRREPGPYPVAGVTVAQLRAARSGFLRYDGMGFSGSGPDYGSVGVLNGVELGEMTPAGGDEVHGVWAEQVGVPLTREAIASLGLHNVFVLQNPRQDWFKVRRFWLDLELADGRRCSSDITTAAFTQPPMWPYAEGILVPFSESITVDIWFRP